jgi:hypothetical protein
MNRLAKALAAQDQQDDVRETIRLLRERYGFFEAYHLQQYYGVRNVGGKSVPCTLTVFDAGPDANPHFRYHAEAVSTEDGKRALGGQAESIEVALAIVHWNALA